MRYRKKDKFGRKFDIAVGILTAATTIMLLPTLFTGLGVVNLSALMTGGEYVSLVIGVFGLYVGGNVYQKKVVGVLGVEESVTGEE
jgi:hypothetical protein